MNHTTPIGDTSPRATVGTHPTRTGTTASFPTPAVIHTRITHVRTSPLRHSFRYHGQSWLVDVDDLPELAAPFRPLARFLATDHFPEPARLGDTLRSRLNRHVAAAGLTVPTGRVTALLSPRVAGYVFNPLSVFWCHDADGSIAFVIAEVHNTYGERHCYIVRPDERGRAEVEKQFYVSPFNDVAGSYRLILPEPGPDGRVHIAITLERTGQAPFVASLSGQAEPVTVRALTLAQLRTPLAPLVVAARIRLHGIRLWLRRLPIQPRPAHPDHTTVAPTQGR
ncbi:DUF1365 domain-containing protein [Gordonia soli]|uniref:DUF1365 domain-containing protein n=1 Tax=Gordonia soli NBRC 108243 TaxID=1223545 RepID=M0QLG4_9ACTN|nr:DUF1365 domain-containing protein [Gordonia soli]GAC69264.1 hypothetical protein GS4_23_00600 [Gordonia soli NBRC 108243]